MENPPKSVFSFFRVRKVQLGDPVRVSNAGYVHCVQILEVLIACSMSALHSPLIAGNRSLQLIQTNFQSFDRIALVTPFVGAGGNRARRLAERSWSLAQQSQIIDASY